jgi:hypothetical protein
MEPGRSAIVQVFGRRRLLLRMSVHWGEAVMPTSRSK